MNHEQIKELLSAFSNGELAITQRDFVEEHLRTCPECVSELNNSNSVRNELTSLRSLPVPESIKGATMARIAAPQARSFAPKIVLRPALAVFALLVALGVPISMLFTNGDSLSAIAQAYAATDGLVSYTIAGTTRSEFQGRTSEASYEWDIIDDHHSQGSLVSDGAEIQFVIDGDEQYAKGAPPGLVLTIENQSVFSRPVPSRQSTLDLLDSLGVIEELPNEALDGADNLRRRGAIDMDRLVDGLIEDYRAENPGVTDFTGIESQRAADIMVDLWIDSESFFISRMVLEMRLPTTTHHGDGTTSVAFMLASTDARYSRFNEAIELELPVDASGELLPGWQAAGATDNPGGVVVEQRLVVE